MSWENRLVRRVEDLAALQERMTADLAALAEMVSGQTQAVNGTRPEYKATWKGRDEAACVAAAKAALQGLNNHLMPAFEALRQIEQDIGTGIRPQPGKGYTPEVVEWSHSVWGDANDQWWDGYTDEDWERHNRENVSMVWETGYGQGWADADAGRLSAPKVPDGYTDDQYAQPVYDFVSGYRTGYRFYQTRSAEPTTGRTGNLAFYESPEWQLGYTEGRLQVPMTSDQYRYLAGYYTGETHRWQDQQPQPGAVRYLLTSGLFPPDTGLAVRGKHHY